MKEKYDLPYLMTSRLDQNYLEGFNSKMRLADGRGANRDPTALMLNYRVARSLTVSILEDESFNIFKLKNPLQKDLELPDQSSDIQPVKIPRKLSESQKDGIFWAAGYIAHRMRKVQSLGAYQRDATTDHAENKFTTSLNGGGLVYPLKTWLHDYQSMEAYFQSYHPKGSIRPGRGLMSNFFNELKKKFPSYADSVLHLVTRVLTRFRLRAINRNAKIKKDKPRKLPKCIAPKGKGKTTPITKRGKRKLADQST